MAKLRVLICVWLVCLARLSAQDTGSGTTFQLPSDGSSFSYPHSGINTSGFAQPALPLYRLPDSLFHVPLSMQLPPDMRLKMASYTDFSSFSFDRDYDRSGVLRTFDNSALFASGSRTTYIGLGVTASSSLSYVYRPVDNLQISVSAMASKYAFGTSFSNQFGFSGNLRYDFNEHVAFNMFGTYYLQQPFYSVAAYPYMGYSNFGAFMSFENDYVGANLGAQRYYNPMLHRWETVPIVMPYVKIGDVPLGVDVGGLLKSLLIDAIQQKRGQDGYFNNDIMQGPLSPLPPSGLSVPAGGSHLNISVSPSRNYVPFPVRK